MQWAENYFGLIYHLFARPTIKLWELFLSIFLIANCLYEERCLCLVATPRSCQGVPRNTLTWRKKILYIIIKIFYICLPSKKILGIPSIKIRNTLKKISSKHTRKKKAQKSFELKIWKNKNKIKNKKIVTSKLTRKKSPICWKQKPTDS